MINGRYKKMLMISYIVIFSIMSIITVIMTENMLHTEHCDIQCCSICTSIEISTDFMKNIGLIEPNILILIVYISLIQLINKNIKRRKEFTLVELKVVQIK